MQSRMIAVSLAEEAADDPQKDEYEIIPLPDEWAVGERTDDNAYMIDACRVIRPGKEPTERKHVYLAGKDIFAEAPEEAAAEFTFFVDDGADIGKLRGMKIVTEQRPSVTVSLNGVSLEAVPSEVWLDRSFTVYSSGGAVKHGENTLTLTGFRDRDDDELGYVYLVGDFGVFSRSGFTDAPHRAEITDGPFYLSDRPLSVRGDDIVKQGYPFFRGNFSFKSSVCAADDSKRYAVSVPDYRGAFVRVLVNGRDAGIAAWGDRTVDVTDLIKPRENTLELDLCVGNRNLLGPHHTREAEPMSVGPGDLYPFDPEQMKKTFAFVKSGLHE